MEYKVFICHAYRHGRLYDLLRSRLNTASHFTMRNVSIPSDMSIVGMSNSELYEEIRGRIASCDVVLAFTSVAASHSDWIKSELDLATELGKPILAISPFRNSRKSQYVLSVATRHVQPWRVDSVVNAIRDLRRASRQTVKIGDIAPPHERSLKSVKDVLRSAFDRRPNALPNVEQLPTPTDTWFRKYWSTREY